jgi:hypothetical protein
VIQQASLLLVLQFQGHHRILYFQILTLDAVSSCATFCSTGEPKFPLFLPRLLIGIPPVDPDRVRPFLHPFPSTSADRKEPSRGHQSSVLRVPLYGKNRETTEFKRAHRPSPKEIGQGKRILISPAYPVLNCDSMQMAVFGGSRGLQTPKFSEGAGVFRPLNFRREQGSSDP